MASLRPKPDVPATIRKVPDPRPIPEPIPCMPVAAALPCTAQNVSDALVLAPVQATQKSPSPAPATVRPLAPERYKLQVTITAETRARLQRAQDLLRHSLPSGDVAVILDRASEMLVADLERKKAATVARPRARDQFARRFAARSRGCTSRGLEARRRPVRIRGSRTPLRRDSVPRIPSCDAVLREASVENIQLRCGGLIVKVIPIRTISSVTSIIPERPPPGRISRPSMRYRRPARPVIVKRPFSSLVACGASGKPVTASASKSVTETLPSGRPSLVIVVPVRAISGKACRELKLHRQGLRVADLEDCCGFCRWRILIPGGGVRHLRGRDAHRADADHVLPRGQTGEAPRTVPLRHRHRAAGVRGPAIGAKAIDGAPSRTATMPATSAS